MVCQHNRIEKFDKKILNSNMIVGLVYCCIDCKNIFEFYGIKGDKDLDVRVVESNDIILDKHYYQYTEVIHAMVKHEAETTRRKLDGEPLRNQTEEEKALTEKLIMGEGFLKQVAKLERI